MIAHHRSRKIRLPNPRLHAAIHVVVENQIAEGEQPVIEKLGQLQADGLSRHDAVHAIGSVVSEVMSEALRGGKARDLRQPYFEALEKLTAQGWRDSG